MKIKNKKKDLKKGFTIVELLVVITIIGILATFVGIGYSRYIDESKSQLAETEVKEIYKAFDIALFNGLETGEGVAINTFEDLEALDGAATLSLFEELSETDLPDDATLKFNDGVLSYGNRGIVVTYSY